MLLKPKRQEKFEIKTQVDSNDDIGIVEKSKQIIPLGHALMLLFAGNETDPDALSTGIQSIESQINEDNCKNIVEAFVHHVWTLISLIVKNKSATNRLTVSMFARLCKTCDLNLNSVLLRSLGSEDAVIQLNTLKFTFKLVNYYFESGKVIQASKNREKKPAPAIMIIEDSNSTNERILDTQNLKTILDIYNTSINDLIKIISSEKPTLKAVWASDLLLTLSSIICLLLVDKHNFINQYFKNDQFDDSNNFYNEYSMFAQNIARNLKNLLQQLIRWFSGTRSLYSKIVNELTIMLDQLHSSIADDGQKELVGKLLHFFSTILNSLTETTGFHFPEYPNRIEENQSKLEGCFFLLIDRKQQNWQMLSFSLQICILVSRAPQSIQSQIMLEMGSKILDSFRRIVLHYGFDSLQSKICTFFLADFLQVDSDATTILEMEISLRVEENAPMKNQNDIYKLYLTLNNEEKKRVSLLNTLLSKALSPTPASDLNHYMNILEHIIAYSTEYPEYFALLKNYVVKHQKHPRLSKFLSSHPSLQT